MQSIIYLQQSNPYLFPILLLLAIVGIAILAVYSIKKSGLVKRLNSDLLNNEHTLKELEEKVETLGSQLNINRESVLELTADKKGLETLINEKDKLLNSFESQLSEVKSEYYDLQSNNLSKEKVISELETTLEKDREMNLEKLQILEEAKEKLSLEFQNLGNRIFEDKTKKFTSLNKENIETVLNPLKEKIKEFDKKVSETYEKETRERVSLVNQIEQLKTLNEKISQDAVNLANALKTETKTQGTWGEFVLEKVLGDAHQVLVVAQVLGRATAAEEDAQVVAGVDLEAVVPVHLEAIDRGRVQGVLARRQQVDLIHAIHRALALRFKRAQ